MMSGRISLNSNGKICLTEKQGLVKLCCPYSCDAITRYVYDFDSSSEEHRNDCWNYVNADILTSGTLTFGEPSASPSSATRLIEIGSGYNDKLIWEVDLWQPTTPAVPAPNPSPGFWGYEFDFGLSLDNDFYDIVLQRFYSAFSTYPAGYNHQTRILVNRPGPSLLLNIPLSATSGTGTAHTLKMVFDYGTTLLDIHWDGVFIGSTGAFLFSDAPLVGEVRQFVTRGQWRGYDDSIRSKMTNIVVDVE